jgi:hypothetical protein
MSPMGAHREEILANATQSNCRWTSYYAKFTFQDGPTLTGFFDGANHIFINSTGDVMEFFATDKLRHSP